jgi:hypothetical protein
MRHATGTVFAKNGAVCGQATNCLKKNCHMRIESETDSLDAGEEDSRSDKEGDI